jgi:hypothetical protein
VLQLFLNGQRLPLQDQLYALYLSLQVMPTFFCQQLPRSLPTLQQRPRPPCPLHARFSSDRRRRRAVNIAVQRAIRSYIPGKLFQDGTSVRVLADARPGVPSTHATGLLFAKVVQYHGKGNYTVKAGGAEGFAASRRTSVDLLVP